MNFYINIYLYYCGIDFYIRLFYVCIIDNENNIFVYEKIDDLFDKLLVFLKFYLGNIVVGVECMYCWYWVFDFCEEYNIDFIFGYVFYMKVIYVGKIKNDKIDVFKIVKFMWGGNFLFVYVYLKEYCLICDVFCCRIYIMRMSV